MKYIINIYWYLFFSFLITASISAGVIYSDYKEYEHDFDKEIEKLFNGASYLLSGSFNSVNGYFISNEGFKNEYALSQGNSYNTTVLEKDNIDALFVVKSNEAFEISILGKNTDGSYRREYIQSTYIGVTSYSPLLPSLIICDFNCEGRYLIDVVNGDSQETPTIILNTYRKAFEHFMQKNMFFYGEDIAQKDHSKFTEMGNRYFSIEYAKPLDFSEDRWLSINNFAKKYEFYDLNVYCQEGIIEFIEVTNIRNIKQDLLQTFLKFFALAIFIYVMIALTRFTFS
ncbi:MAG: hypothetical protein ACK4WD_04690 [Flavobacteriales bacterium]|jgi:hypothetical protein